MGLYNVVAPCVVGKLHHVRPTTAPIEVDDEVAAPLVEAGKLTVFGASDISVKPFQEDVTPDHSDAGQEAGAEFAEGIAGKTGDVPDDAVVNMVEPEPEKPAPRPRGRRRPSED